MYKEFQQCTVLSVAHRLRTVTSCDFILILDNGKVCDFDTPLSLINNTNSRFYEMCESTNEVDTLKDMIYTAIKRKEEMVSFTKNNI